MTLHQIPLLLRDQFDRADSATVSQTFFGRDFMRGQREDDPHQSVRANMQPRYGAPLRPLHQLAILVLLLLGGLGVLAGILGLLNLLAP